MTTTIADYRIMLSAGITSDDIRDGLRRSDTLGEIAWSQCRDRSNEDLHGLEGWPECECCGCDCANAAVTTDDGGVPVCEACSVYTIDDDGHVICSQSERGDELEEITECCGAGGQTRTYTRLRPPTMPQEDEDGEWACYWETVGDDSHVVSRHSTRELAEQAIAAHDWPPPGDHTQYLCGYALRVLDGDQWIVPDEE